MDAENLRGGEDWSLPEAVRPPLLSELVERIDLALATARASEAAVMTVGAAALDAAEQAKRAAELAERASAGLAGAEPDDAGLRKFSAHADRISARLRELERQPLAATV
jgi:hypothetical protein